MLNYLTRLVWGGTPVAAAKSAAVASGALANPGADLLALFGGGIPTRAGANVTPETALTVPVLLAARRLLTETIASLPLHVYRRGANGAKERASDHPVYRLLHDQPNPWTTAPELFEDLVGSAIDRGHGFALVNRVGGTVREIIGVPGTAMTTIVRVAEAPIYRLSLAGGGTREYSRADIVHLRINGGRGIVNTIRESVGLLIALQGYASGLFGSGARPGGFLEGTASMSEEARANLRKALAEAGRPENLGKILNLPPGVSFRPTQFTSVDAQTVEIWRIAILDVARAFKIPPHMLAELDRATYSNTENMGREFLQLALHPILKQLEGAIELAVFGDDERGKYFVEFLTDDLVRADLEKRFKAFHQAAGGPWMSRNEIRATDNLPPIEGGNDLIVPLNMTNSNPLPTGSNADD